MAMTAPAFDSLATARDLAAAAKALREAGFDGAQAEAAVATMRDAVTEGGATKADLSSLETRLTVRFYGGLLAAVAAVVALRKLLPQAAP